MSNFKVENFNDLQNHDIVLLENGKRFMVYILNGSKILINKNSYIDGSFYNEDTFTSDLKGFDIVEVRRPIYPLHFMEEKWSWAKMVWWKDK